MASAEKKALGLTADNTSLDGYVGFNSAANTFSYAINSAPPAGQYYFVGVVEHEFTEIMGRTSYLGFSGEYSAMDLFRFAGVNARQFSTSSPSYFSIDNGVTNLNNWNNFRTGNRGDLGDWAPSAGNDALDDNTNPGVVNAFTQADITSMNVLGWTLTAAPPSPPPASPSPPPPPPPTFGTVWTLAGVGDTNSDRFADLVWRNQQTSQVQVQLLNGTTSLGAGPIANSPFDSSWSIAATGDFNGDGDTDLIYRHGNDGLTAIQFLNGLQAAGGGAIPNNPFGPDWNIVATGDFTGEGDSDLVWRQASSGLVEIQLLNGLTPAGGGVIPNNPFGADWQIVTTGSFNGNGKDGLVWQNPSTGLVELQFLDGITPVGGGVIAGNPFGMGWNVVGAGDFLGNGFGGLVYQRQSDDLVEIQFLRGTTAVGGGVIANSPFGSGWKVGGVGDFNGDGKADLLYRNAATGMTEVQFLNGAIPIGGGIVAVG
jgi:hypothetical protein